MEFKTLIIGLFLSTAAFAVKAGGGLAYLFLQTPDKRQKAVASFGFMVVYGLVFLLAALILAKINLTRHLDLLQGFFKSGMTLHFLLALLLAVWGIRLLLKNRQDKQATQAWIPLLIPCPVCFSVILLSCSFVSALYPGSFLVFVYLYAGFILISLTVAAFFTFMIRKQKKALAFLGTLMLYIAGYFMLSVILIPQFADLERIYRISLIEKGIAMQIFALLKTFIYLIASSLFAPVLLILSCLVLWMLAYSGTFFISWIQRRRMQVKAGELPELILSGHTDSILPGPVAVLTKKLKKIQAQKNPALVINLLRDSEHNLWKSLDSLKMMIRIGPGLGLIGTLIPMGTGLASLGQGDLGQLSQDLVVAFTTTVVGMALGLLAYFFFTIQHRWIEQDIKNMELAAELLCGEQAQTRTIRAA